MIFLNPLSDLRLYLGSIPFPHFAVCHNKLRHLIRIYVKICKIPLIVHRRADRRSAAHLLLSHEIDQRMVTNIPYLTVLWKIFRQKIILRIQSIACRVWRIYIFGCTIEHLLLYYKNILPVKAAIPHKVGSRPDQCQAPEEQHHRHALTPMGFLYPPQKCAEHSGQQMHRPHHLSSRSENKALHPLQKESDSESVDGHLPPFPAATA